MPYQTQKWSSPQVSRIGPLFRKFGSILYGKGPSQEPQNKCSGGFGIYEHKQKTSTKLNSIKSSYQPMIWWILWNIWHRVRVSWSRSVPPWTFATNFLHNAHGATTIERQNCNDPAGRLRVPWPRPNRHKEPAIWAGQMGPGVSLDVRLTHTRTSLMDSTGAQTGPITSHHQLGETSPRRSKVGPSDHPHTYKSPEIYIWGRISHQHLLQMKNTRKKKSGSGGNRRCGQYLSDSYMGKIVCMDNSYMYIVVSWRAYVHTSTLHVWIFLSIFLVSNSGIPIPWKWLKTIHRNCKFRK